MTFVVGSKMAHRLDEAKRRSVMLSVRVQPRLQRNLRVAARRNNVSVSQEIERRLQESFPPKQRRTAQ
jgi:predicted HicB family RNase H-like nuclease